MTTWDLSETHTQVRRIYGRDQERLVQESTRSVNDRKDFSSYHFQEAMRLSKAFERKHLKGLRSTLELHASGAEKNLMAFEVYMVKAGAHSIAALQSLHALPDIFAHVVYFATGQNLSSRPLPDRLISLKSVARSIRADPVAASLSSPLESLQRGAAWDHLDAAANMSKHRSVVRPLYSEDWTGKRKNARELQIAAFERGGKHYAPKSVRELLEPEYNRLSLSIISMGQQLNACLRRIR